MADITLIDSTPLRGALRIPYKVEDDYGVASLEGRIARIREKADTINMVVVTITKMSRR